jgi:hypothetical protein
VSDDAEREVVAEDVGAGYEDQQRRKRDEHAVDRQPAAVLLEVGLHGTTDHRHHGLGVDLHGVHGRRGVLAPHVPQQALLGDALGHHPEPPPLEALEPAMRMVVFVLVTTSIALDAVEGVAELADETAEEPAVVIGCAGGIFVRNLAVQFVPVGPDRDQKHLHARRSYDSTASRAAPRCVRYNSGL